jgi:hypothetical protein
VVAVKLRPHAVDKWSGYRYYTPGQLDRLITLANEAGGPGNIACAVADVIAAS